MGVEGHRIGMESGAVKGETSTSDCVAETARKKTRSNSWSFPKNRKKGILKGKGDLIKKEMET